MSKIRRLLQSYGDFIAIPWRNDAAAAQRVIFCIYHESDELRIRSRIEEFELLTKQTGHSWLSFDLTDSFAKWISTQRYANSYFQKPTLLATIIPKYLDFIVHEFANYLHSSGSDEESVVAIQGVGSLFGFIKVKDLVDHLAPLVKGRLLVLFPGSFENNNYRLLDGYDGWNYLAVPISANM